MAVVLESLATLSVLVFVTGTLSTRLNLTVGQVLDPLRDPAMAEKALLDLTLDYIAARP